MHFFFVQTKTKTTTTTAYQEATNLQKDWQVPKRKLQASNVRITPRICTRANTRNIARSVHGVTQKKRAIDSEEEKKRRLEEATDPILIERVAAPVPSYYC